MRRASASDGGAGVDVGATMRLDRFLWFARLTKTRTAAQALACDGRLRIDGRTIDRAHASVRVGNVLTFVQGGGVQGGGVMSGGVLAGDAPRGRVLVLRIEALPRRRGPAPEARSCYQELTAGPPVGTVTVTCANNSQENAED